MSDTTPHRERSIESDPLVIQAELARLLEERRFAGAPQMSAFLRYIVRETLKGNAERIKAYSVGVDALGKPDSFDAQTDPSVRVLALRLRKTLSAIYEDSSDHFAIIELKVGTYVPMFYKAPTQKESGPLTGVGHSSVVTSFDRRQGNSVSVCDRDDRSSLQTNRQLDSQSESISKSVSYAPIKQSLPMTANDQNGPRRFADAREQQLSSRELVANNSTYARWLVVGAAFLLMAAWQIAAKNTDVQAGTQNSLSRLMAVSLSTSGPSEETTTSAPRSRPAVLVENIASASAEERRIMLMLTARLVQSQSIDVINIADSLSIAQSRPGQYLLFVSGYSVDDVTRFDTQIVSLFDGEMLFAKTMVLKDSPGTFSASEVDSIEALVASITDTQGPLYEDYCALGSHAQLEFCKAG